MSNSLRIALLNALCLLLLYVQAFPVYADNVPPTNSAINASPAQILSTGSPRVVLKNGNSLLVIDKNGMIDSRLGSPYGLFEDDTRYLSRWQIQIDDKDPTLVTAFTQGGYHGSFIYSLLDEVLIQRDLLLYKGMSERITLSNFANHPYHLKVSISHGTDFKDMFEVRGQKREKAGQFLGYWLDNESTNRSIIRSSYKGLDQRDYQSYITANDKPSKLATDIVNYEIDLKPQESKTIDLRVDTSNTPESLRSTLTYDKAKSIADAEYKAWRKEIPEFKIDWDQLNDMVAQSVSDIYLLRQDTAYGPCLAAGLPWYSTAFGRDQCVTALQTLPFMPGLAKDLIKVLAAYQGKKVNSFTEEAPGRIMHELRLGEMAKNKEIAFMPYYGTVDATPLWLVLVSRYVDATGDVELAKQLWTNIEAALQYIEGSVQADGFLYYGGKAGAALSNQAWKDSGDSIMHKNGELAKAPIAVCEVQGYLYEAYNSLAKLAKKLGKESLVKSLRQKSELLKQNFHKKFWMTDMNFVALAVDGTGSPCQVVSSNPGHLLSSGILNESEAQAVAERLLKGDMFSGWGIRTLSTQELRYNPMSYHDGSVWPHDNAMTVEGMSAIGRSDLSCTVLENLVQSAKGASDARLPELFCGFPRDAYEAPIPYAVSCVPQAWAAGSLFQMLRSILGIHLQDGKVVVDRPKLPSSINSVEISNLKSGNARVTLKFEKNRQTNEVKVSASSDEVVIRK